MTHCARTVPGTGEHAGDAPPAPDGQDLQTELSRAMREAWGRFKQGVGGRVGAFGLSALQARLLRQIDGRMTMRQLADAIGTEPSNLTPVVDRLEAAGLVQRRAKPGDRRVRELCLTAPGVELRDRVGAEVFGSMTTFDRLTSDEQRQLLVLLDKLASP